MELNDLRDQEIQQLAKDYWDNIVAASNQKDYALFARDFSEKMKRDATKENIEKQWLQTPLLCDLLPEPEFMGLLQSQNSIRVLWKQRFKSEADESLGQLILIDEDGEIKIDGATLS